ncbi:MAG: hypothetical protein LBQ49_00945, partial [Rickettsiales bacterium]|nr:hypothetical protein [Rickettsiales bacterium]
MPCVFCALTFALAFFAPISAFSDFNGDKAAITNAKSIETAKITLMKAVENLAADWKDKVNKSVRDKAIRDAKAASEKTYSAEDVADLRRKADAAKENETSLENRMLGGLTMAATGIGGMQMMQGIAEMNADKAADAEMRSYLSTIICGIGGGKSVPYENTGSSPEDPGQLFTARRKYMELAGKTKSAKEVLGMAPGIESELIADTSRLYQNRGTDTDGINRALGEDYVSERAEANSGRD